MNVCLHVKYLLFLSDNHRNRTGLKDLGRNIKMKNFMNICAVGFDVFHAGRQTVEGQ